ncbi:MAG: molybdopterin-dependent oxidoreductase, partial [Cytophagaceae bacterium]|nr:molybdopterin-dependent oxidoreductase [Gemmatimonadaceae bacterium]
MSQPMGPDGASGGVKRRTFLKVLGAAGAATTAVGCTNEQVEKLIPYLQSPDQTVPGVSTYYSTTCRECATACGVVAEVRDGRAIKLEGQPDHPVNQGALCAKGQASLQGLYNPDRYRTPMVREGGKLVPTTWDAAIRTLSQKIGESRGAAGNAVFVTRPDSGTFAGFLDGWLAAYGFQPHWQYDPTADLAGDAANVAAYGVAMPRLDFAAARLVISIGADFLDGWGASVPQQLSFAEARAKLQDGPRFVYIGPRRSLTGLNADVWISCIPGSEGAIASALLSAVGGSGGTIAAAAQASGVSEATLQALADELRGTRPSLVISGVSTPDANAVAATAAAINRATGAVGVTIKPAEAISGFGGAVGTGAMQTLAASANAGTVKLLFVRGVNPAYDTPKAMQFAAAMAKVPFKVSFSSYPDETSELCDLVLPDDHFLESWGDAQATPGVVALQQPVMDRIFATRATADVLLDVARADATMAARYPQRSFREVITGTYGAAAITAALPKATISGSTGTRTVAAMPSPQAGALGGDGDFFLVTYPHAVLGAGEGANKPWLQELPDPVAKIVWQSWVEINPATAARLGVKAGDHLTVTTAAGSVTAPAYLYLGIRPDTVAIALGQGHTKYGRYAENIGVNALDALGATYNGSGALSLTQAKARVVRAGEHSPLVTLEGSARQHGRGIAQAMTVAELLSGAEEEHHALPGDASHEFLPGLRSPVANDAQGDLGDPKSASTGMYDPEHWSGMAKRRWAMVVDLARCTGCSACVTACYAENNIPTVGAR